MENYKYFLKYNKYKKKYLYLLKQLGGSNKASSVLVFRKVGTIFKLLMVVHNPKENEARRINKRDNHRFNIIGVPGGVVEHGLDSKNTMIKEFKEEVGMDLPRLVNSDQFYVYNNTRTGWTTKIFYSDLVDNNVPIIWNNDYNTKGITSLNWGHRKAQKDSTGNFLAETMGILEVDFNLIANSILNSDSKPTPDKFIINIDGTIYHIRDAIFYSIKEMLEKGILNKYLSRTSATQTHSAVTRPTHSAVTASTSLTADLLEEIVDYLTEKTVFLNNSKPLREYRKQMSFLENLKIRINFENNDILIRTLNNMSFIIEKFNREINSCNNTGAGAGAGAGASIPPAIDISDPEESQYLYIISFNNIYRLLSESIFSDILLPKMDELKTKALRVLSNRDNILGNINFNNLIYELYLISREMIDRQFIYYNQFCKPDTRTVVSSTVVGSTAPDSTDPYKLPVRLPVTLIDSVSKYKILGRTQTPTKSRLLDYRTDLYVILTNSIGDYLFGSNKTDLNLSDFSFRQPLHIEIFNPDKITHKHDKNLLTDNVTISKIKVIDNPTASSVEIEIYKTYHITLVFHNNIRTKTPREIDKLKQNLVNNIAEYTRNRTRYRFNENGIRFLQYLATGNATGVLQSVTESLNNIYHPK